MTPTEMDYDQHQEWQKYMEQRLSLCKKHGEFCATCRFDNYCHPLHQCQACRAEQEDEFEEDYWEWAERMERFEEDFDD